MSVSRQKRDKFPCILSSCRKTPESLGNSIEKAVKKFICRLVFLQPHFSFSQTSTVVSINLTINSRLAGKVYEVVVVLELPALYGNVLGHDVVEPNSRDK